MAWKRLSPQRISLTWWLRSGCPGRGMTWSPKGSVNPGRRVTGASGSGWMPGRTGGWNRTGPWRVTRSPGTAHGSRRAHRGRDRPAAGAGPAGRGRGPVRHVRWPYRCPLVILWCGPPAVHHGRVVHITESEISQLAAAMGIVHPVAAVEARGDSDRGSVRRSARRPGVAADLARRDHPTARTADQGAVAAHPG